MSCIGAPQLLGAVTTLQGCAQRGRHHQKLPCFTLDRILDVKIPPRTTKVSRQALATAREVSL